MIVKKRRCVRNEGDHGAGEPVESRYDRSINPAHSGEVVESQMSKKIHDSHLAPNQTLNTSLRHHQYANHQQNQQGQPDDKGAGALAQNMAFAGTAAKEKEPDMPYSAMSEAYGYQDHISMTKINEEYYNYIKVKYEANVMFSRLVEAGPHVIMEGRHYE